MMKDKNLLNCIFGKKSEQKGSCNRDELTAKENKVSTIPPIVEPTIQTFLNNKKEQIAITKTDLSFKDDKNQSCNDLLDLRQLLIDFYLAVYDTDYSVYALTGGWGTGKTSFVKMFKNIASKQTNVIYIDAYQNDYNTDPFSMIINAFAEYLKNNSKLGIDQSQKNNFFESAKKIAFSTGKALGKIAIAATLNHYLGKDADKDLHDLLKDVSGSFIDDFSYEKDDAEDIYLKFQSAAENLIEKMNSVTIIIDELDRCRPTFALETIEKIKHIFNIQGFKFILVYNKEIMKSVVKKEYGIEETSERYVSKLVEKEFELPENGQLDIWIGQELDILKDKGMDPTVFSIYSNRILQIAKIMKQYHISLRTMIRVFQNTSSIKKTTTPSTIKIYNQVCITNAVIQMLKVIDSNEYRDMCDYILKNGSFATNTPKRDVYNSIYMIFDGNNIEYQYGNNIQDGLSEEFKNYHSW